jgi:hypothetical protein
MKKYLTRNDKGQFIHATWIDKITIMVKKWLRLP